MDIIQDNIAYFMLPGFYEHFELYNLINEFLIQHPDAQYPWTKIYCYYGNFPYCIWDGGRIFNTYFPASIERIDEVCNYYQSNNQKLRLVFTNSLIEEQHCYNHYNNIILQKLHNNNNEIVINSPILENYIKKHYPKYSLISSTTKCLNTPVLATSELLEQNYKFVCLDYNLNHNWDFLNTLSASLKKKTEFLINPICGPNCPSRKKHYKYNSIFSLTCGEPFNIDNCQITEMSICPANNNTIITLNEIKNIYLPQGFQFFKIEGRTLSSREVALIFSECFIKPEYKNLFLRNINVLLKEKYNI